MVNIYNIKYIDKESKDVNIKIYAEKFKEAYILCKKFHSDCQEIIKIEITDKGREIYGESIKRESVHEIMSVLSEKERRQMILLLKKVLEKALEVSQFI